MSDEAILYKRRQKFSEEARQAILNDQLKDHALLSRSHRTSDILQDLLHDENARLKLLQEIEKQELIDPDGNLVERGLRKLREVIVAAKPKSRRKPAFVHLAIQVYIKTIRFYCRRRENHKSLPGLRFYVENLLENADPRDQQRSHELIACCALYIAHSEQDILRCLELLKKHLYGNKIYDHCRVLASVYCLRSEPPCVWFATVSQFPDTSLVRSFLLTLPAFHEMQRRTIKVICTCYNQLSLSFISSYWFHHLWEDIESYLIDHWAIEVYENGSKVAKFKKQKVEGSCKR
ncbi:LADA_0G04412g1_1 [Lachancea dasiensis]|uniref:LADA_0G04412g1_1 n=1 Tax=Lachancea dasiensis TaxID=1072105 RepID=A0A1G4JSK5_9SACH|nr:LADA_0G04412g1_1 [Lachancea dasiensis]